MVKTRSEAIFMKDCAPLHTSKCNQNWCANQVFGVWDKGPGNSPKLNPIKHLLYFLKQSLDKQESATNPSQFARRPKVAYENISDDTLRNLMLNMLSRVE